VVVAAAGSNLQAQEPRNKGVLAAGKRSRNVCPTCIIVVDLSCD